MNYPGNELAKKFCTEEIKKKLKAANKNQNILSILKKK